MSFSGRLTAALVLVSFAACGGDARVVTLALAPVGGPPRVATYDAASGVVTLAAADLDGSDAVPVTLIGARGALLRDRDVLVVLDDHLAVARRIDVKDPGDTTPAGAFAVLAVSATKVYVLRRARNTVLVVDPTKDGDAARLGTIDLGVLAAPFDTDGLVDVAAGARAGNRAYVACARDYTGATGLVFPAPSVLAVIDTATDTLVDVDGVRSGIQAVELEQSGPVAVATAAGRVYVASSARPGMSDGGIEVVDPGTFSTRTIVGEATLMPTGASPVDLEDLVAARGRLLAIAAGRAVLLDAGSGAVVTTLVPSGAVAAVALPSGDVVVGLHTTLAVFDLATEHNLTPAATPASFDAARVLLGVASP